MIFRPVFTENNEMMGGNYAGQESRRKGVRGVLTAAEKKAMDLEIQRELAEYDRKHIAEIDATILWVLHEQFGFGAQRLRTYYDAFHDRIKELVSRYEMEAQDDIWLCTQMLKRIGVDVEAWHKESEHGT